MLSVSINSASIFRFNELIDFSLKKGSFDIHNISYNTLNLSHQTKLTEYELNREYVYTCSCIINQSTLKKYYEILSVK